MRMAHFRLSVRGLLLTIAVVAVNLAAYRNRSTLERWLCRYAGPFYVVDVFVGAIPLFNVAMIGTSLVSMRGFRALANRRTATFSLGCIPFPLFSVHFSILLLLGVRYAPETTAQLRDAYGDLLTRPANELCKIVGEPGETPLLIAAALVGGLVVSGPPLAAAWLGRLLARRCAARISPLRFGVLIGLISLAFGSAALAICVTPRPFRDERAVAIAIRVVDRDSGRPISGAVVSLLDPLRYGTEADSPRARTGRDGRARLAAPFEATGEANAFRDMGAFSTWGLWLEVTAAGHRTVRIPLPEVLGPEVDLAGPGLGTVMLERGRPPSLPFHALAGVYVSEGSSGFGGGFLKIEADGTFAWEGSGCMYRCLEYGRFCRRGQEIELSPVPQAGREPHPEVLARFRLVRWGSRFYLCHAEQKELEDFCWRVLNPNRRSRSDLYGSYLRVERRERPLSGIPQVPMQVWVRCLRRELSESRLVAGLRSAIAALGLSVHVCARGAVP